MEALDMKVWMCRRTDGNYGYSGGIAVVAANSKEEAFKTFFEDEDYQYMVDKFDFQGQLCDDYKTWKSSYYPIDGWYECKILSANVDKPCVIMEDGYTE